MRKQNIEGKVCSFARATGKAERPAYMVGIWWGWGWGRVILPKAGCQFSSDMSTTERAVTGSAVH